MTQLTTGQPTVDAIGKMNFLEGSYVPHTWLKHLTYSNKRGTYTHHLAVLLLADVVYWYRPTVVKDQHSGELLGWRKKFAGDKLQRSYEAIASHLGATYKQAREAVLFLKDIGLITTEFRNFTTDTGLFVSNALYLEPVAEQISRITSSIKNEPLSEIGKPYSEIGKRSAEMGRTYTETSPETSSKTSLIQSHIHRDDESEGLNNLELEVNSTKEEEAGQQKDDFADPSQPVAKKKISHVANKSPSDDQSSATFENPELLKLVEYVDELPLNSDGSRRYPWNKPGRGRHCRKFAEWLFLNHLYKCSFYNDGKPFKSHLLKAFSFLVVHQRNFAR